jgi:Protein of unknown function (DUF1706)
MKKSQLLERLEKAWTTLQESYTGFSDPQLIRPGVMGDWSVKDILAHVTTWEEETLKYLPLILSGGRPPRYTQSGGIDAFNARMVEQNRAMELSDVLRQLDETHHTHRPTGVAGTRNLALAPACCCTRLTIGLKTCSYRANASW